MARDPLVPLVHQRVKLHPRSAGPRRYGARPRSRPPSSRRACRSTPGRRASRSGSTVADHDTSPVPSRGGSRPSMPRSSEAGRPSRGWRSDRAADPPGCRCRPGWRARGPASQSGSPNAPMAVPGSAGTRRARGVDLRDPAEVGRVEQRPVGQVHRRERVAGRHGPHALAGRDRLRTAACTSGSRAAGSAGPASSAGFRPSSQTSRSSAVANVSRPRRYPPVTRSLHTPGIVRSQPRSREVPCRR